MNLSKRNLLIFSIVFLLVTPSLVALAQTEGSGEPTVVANVNGEDITQQELVQESQSAQLYMSVMRRQTQLPQKLTNFLYNDEERFGELGKPYLEEYHKYVLETMIERELQLQKIQSLDITADEEAIKEGVSSRIDSLIQGSQQYNSQEDLKDAVEEQTDQSWDEFKERFREPVRESILLENLKNEKTSEVKVTEDEMKTYYEDNKEKYEQDGDVQPFEEVKSNIKTTLENQEKSEAWNNWLRKIKEEAEIVRYEENIPTDLRNLIM